MKLLKPAGMAVLSCVALAGCQTSRIGYGVTPQPAPLPAAPAGTVQQGALPPVSSTEFPTAPVIEQPVMDAGLQPATIGNGATQAAAANAAPVSRDALVGAWKVSTGGSSCQMFMALTQWSGGYRAASRGCPGDAASVSAWNVSGSQVVLKDSNGNTVARLYASGATRYDGTTSGGQAISLSR